MQWAAFTNTAKTFVSKISGFSWLPQVTSKRVQNAKSERFYKQSLGKKKQGSYWQVGGAHSLIKLTALSFL